MTATMAATMITRTIAAIRFQPSTPVIEPSPIGIVARFGLALDMAANGVYRLIARQLVPGRLLNDVAQDWVTYFMTR